MLIETKSQGAAVYFEENATINNFVSFGSRFEYVKQTYRGGATTSDSEKTYACSGWWIDIQPRRQLAMVWCGIQRI